MILLRAAVLAVLTLSGPAVARAGDPGRGAVLFQNYMACHSPSPGEHMTGPSLAGVWQRKAGSAENFARYADALKQSGPSGTKPRSMRGCATRWPSRAAIS